MKRALLSLVLVAAAISARAQSAPESGYRIRVAYGVSQGFSTNDGRSTLRGPEIAVALPIGTVLNQGLWLEPSYFGGGRLVHGTDSDADVYRLTVYAHHAFKRFGVRLGVGYAGTAQPRSGNFDGESSYVVDLGVDVPFRVRLLKGVQPYVDVHNLFSDKNLLTGFFVGLGLKL